MTENTCERATDLVAFLYHELDEREGLAFRLHLQECGQCRDEAAELGVVRESIAAWRDEALAGFVSTPVTTKRKSAIAALRQFFDLSPLWLKGATAFALIAFCALAGIAVMKLRTNNVPAVSNARYTEHDLNQRVNEALAKQADAIKPTEVATVSGAPKPKKPKLSSPNQLAKSRRPLSRAEREQLAADLRLLSTADDGSLNLLGDRINQ
jgi:anti-sigma factor RsiW